MNADPTDLSSVLGSQLERFDLSGLNTGVSFSELVLKAVNGEIDLSLSGVANAGLGLFFNEFLLNAQLIRQLLVIAVLGAMLKCLSDAFKHKAAGELGFYVTYIMAVLLAFSSFQLSVGILSDLVSQLSGSMESAVPLIVSLLAMSGSVGSAAVFHPVLIFAVQMITRFISEIFIPVLLAAAVLQIVNHLAEGAPLSKLTVLIRKGADLTLKGIVFLFALLLTLQKITVPIADNLALKTAKAAANAVPVVGGALGSAVDAVLFAGSAAKHGVLAALIIVICVSAAAPLLKMLALMLTCKLTAALIQPVCDERIANCLDSIGSFTAILTGAGALVVVMFIYAVVILLLF